MLQNDLDVYGAAKVLKVHLETVKQPIRPCQDLC